MANTLRFKRGLVSGIPTAALGEPLFTTDTFDLYIGNGTGNTRFQKYIASGTTSQLLRGDGSLLTMPIVLTSPSNGQVLKFNGTSWVNDSDAGITGSGSAGQVAYFTGATTQSGSNNLFWDATNNRLGIGTNTPSTTLQVQGTGNITIQAASSNNFPLFQLVDSRVGGNTWNIEGGRTLSNLQIRSGSGGQVLELSAIGNFGLGVSPSAWGNTIRAMQVASTGASFWSYTAASTTDEYLFIDNNSYNDNTNNIYIRDGAAARYRQFGGQHSWWNAPSGTAGNTTTFTQAMTLTDTGRLLLGSITDNGLRLQVTGDGFFSGSVGIGSTSLTGYNLRVSKNLGGAGTSISTSFDGQIQSGVTTAVINLSIPTTAAALALGEIRGYQASLGTQGAGTTITTVTGFLAHSSLTQGTTNYGFYGDIASGTGRWNLYMNGSAQNYVNGNLLVGDTTFSAAWTRVIHVGTSANNKIAIGHLASATNGAAIASTNGAINAWAELNFVGSQLIFRIAEVERMRLDASGNLGLGVTPSAWNVADWKTMQINFGSVTANSSSFIEVGANYFYDGTNFKYLAASQGATRYRQNTGIHSWYNAPVGSAGTNITFTQAMTLDASGRLAVGTTSIFTPFTVATTNTRFELSEVSSTLQAIEAINTARSVSVDFGIYSRAFRLYTRPSGTGSYTNHLTLADTGNLLVGTTTDAGFRLDVNGTMRVNGNATMTNAVLTGGGTSLVTGTGLFSKSVIQVFDGGSASTNVDKIADLVLVNNTSFTDGIVGRVIGVNTNPALTEKRIAQILFQIDGDTRAGQIILGTTNSASVFNNHLTIRATGAATFSSSVTANSFAINTSGQSRTMTTFYGSGSDGSNIFIGGGGLSSTTGGGAATNGSYNTTLGVNALLSNTTGYSNTVMGASSMVYNTTGLNNSAFGRSSLGDNTTGDDNTSVGLAALLTNTTGDGNTALGFQAGWGNGTNANTTGGNNIFIGNLSVGESATESNRTWIGNTSTASTWVGGNLLVGTRTNGSYKADINGTLRATQFNLSALNTAPATSSSTGTLGEIIIDADHIYVCTATNTWKRVAISTF